MLRIWCVLSLVCYLVLFSSNSRDVDSSRFTTVKPEIKVQEFTSTAFLYERLNLDTILPFHAFEQAHRGYQNVKNMDRPILSIIDFTKPSTDKRMVVLNMEKEEVLFHTIVSHGRNSGDNYARSFSNRHGSYQSSL